MKLYDATQKKSCLYSSSSSKIIYAASFLVKIFLEYVLNFKQRYLTSFTLNINTTNYLHYCCIYTHHTKNCSASANKWSIYVFAVDSYNNDCQKLWVKCPYHWKLLVLCCSFYSVLFYFIINNDNGLFISYHTIIYNCIRCFAEG